MMTTTVVLQGPRGSPSSAWRSRRGRPITPPFGSNGARSAWAPSACSDGVRCRRSRHRLSARAPATSRWVAWWRAPRRPSASVIECSFPARAALPTCAAFGGAAARLLRARGRVTNVDDPVKRPCFALVLRPRATRSRQAMESEAGGSSVMPECARSTAGPARGLRRGEPTWSGRTTRCAPRVRAAIACDRPDDPRRDYQTIYDVSGDSALVELLGRLAAARSCSPASTPARSESPSRRLLMNAAFASPPSGSRKIFASSTGSSRAGSPRSTGPLPTGCRSIARPWRAPRRSGSRGV